MARPREFDSHEVLDQMTGVFWEKGYEGTSMRDLLKATGLNKQSLYGAFGNKQEIYLAVLKNYEETHLRPVAEMLRGTGSPRDRIGQLLQMVIDVAIKSSDRRGCLIGNAAVDRSVLDKKANAKVLSGVRQIEKNLAETIGEMAPYKLDKSLCRRQARALLAAYFGMHVLVKAGVDRSVLEDVRDATLKSL